MRERGGNENIYKYMDEKIIFTHKVFIRYFVIGQLLCKNKTIQELFLLVCFRLFVAADKMYFYKNTFSNALPFKNIIPNLFKYDKYIGM